MSDVDQKRADYESPGGGLEWDRLCRFLHAPDPPIALVEVESRAQADEIIARIRDEVGSLSVVSVDPAHDAERTLDSLLGENATAGSDGLRLIAAVDAPGESEDDAREFWRWLNHQRERLERAPSRLAFLLTPAHADALARWAESLWDWIPLKFSFLRQARMPEAVRQQLDAMAMLGTDRDFAAVVRSVPALRAQLFEARKQGLPESVVQRDYAWPLFCALTSVGCISDATVLLDTELPGSLAGPLPADKRLQWLTDLGLFHLMRWELEEAESAYSAALKVAGDLHDEDGLAVTLHQLGRIAEERRRFDEAEKWYRESLAIEEKLGDEHSRAVTLHQLGKIAEKRGRLDEAMGFYETAIEMFGRLNDSHLAAIAQRSLERTRAAAREREDAGSDSATS